MDAEDLQAVLAEHAVWVKDDTKGGRANLSAADLRGADLRGAYLNRADLRRADDADLRGADLRGADLRRADLSDADLNRALLCDCNFNGARISYRGAIVTVQFEPTTDPD
jgi:uncharacterized protein YjbI with pentapeptide repeats